MITIAERRTIMTGSMHREDFRELLRRDPDAAYQEAIGRAAPRDATIRVIEEVPGTWDFVVPAGDIEAKLPEAADARGVIENDVYAILRDEPAVREDAIANPKAFLAARLHVELGDADINVHEEQPGEIMLILPHGDSRDELSDSALDLVSGGGPALMPGEKGEDMAGPRDS